MSFKFFSGAEYSPAAPGTHPFSSMHPELMVKPFVTAPKQLTFNFAIFESTDVRLKVVVYMFSSENC